MKQGETDKKRRLGYFSPILALLLFVAAVVTTPLAFSKYFTTGEGAAAARVAKWDPKAVVGETILFRDYTVEPASFHTMKNAKVNTNILSNAITSNYSFNNSTTEVATKYSLLGPSELMPATSPLLPYALADHTGSWDWPSAPRLPLQASAAAPADNAKWRRWYINDRRIDTAQGTNGLVWEQNFDSLPAGMNANVNAGYVNESDTTPNINNYYKSLFPNSSLYFPSTRYNYDISVNNASLASGDRHGPLMSGNWLVFGTWQGNGEHDHHMRYVLFDRPAGVGDNWAMEFDMMFGWGDYGHDVREGQLFHFVVWDDSSTSAHSTNPRTSPPITFATSPQQSYLYMFGFTKNTYENNGDNSGWKYTKKEGETFYAYRFTGLLGRRTGQLHFAGTPKYGTPSETQPLGPNDEAEILPHRQSTRRVSTNTSRFFDEAEFVHVRVERSGCRFTMYVNGEQVIQYNRLQTFNPNYRIGFNEMRGVVGIDNIKMWALRPESGDSTLGEIPPAASGMYRLVGVQAEQID